VLGGPTQNEAVAFATTHWSVVLTAQGESPAAQEAVEPNLGQYTREQANQYAERTKK
jgi:hypothetical protein